MARIRSSSVPGQPGFGVPKSNWPRIPRALRKPRTLPTRIVNDVADGRTQPEFKNIVTADGVSTPGRGGYKGARRVMATPMTPPAPGTGMTRIRTPRLGRLLRR